MRGLVGVMLAGCVVKEADTQFPAGLNPLEENTAPWPDSLEESVQTTMGDSGEHYWAHARGYVQADLETVYPCLREDMVNADRREVAIWTREDNVEEGYEYSYQLHFLVENIIDLEFTDTWRHGSLQDEDGQLTAVQTRWKMTEGNEFMFLKEGSIVSAIPEVGWTSLELVGHLDAAQRDEETMASYLVDVFADVVACAHGDPYPTFDE